MNDPVKNHLTSPDIWLRLVFMLVFAVLIQVAAAVMWVVVLAQFIFVLFSGKTNANLKQFSASLATYIFQCWRFLSFNRDDKPYPFQDWPTSNDEP